MYPHQVCVLVQAVQPKLEAMEAAWYRLHSISGAATPDQVIAYWEGMTLLQTCTSNRDRQPGVVATKMHAVLI